MGLFYGGSAASQSSGDLTAQLAEIQKQIAAMERNGVGLGGGRHEELLKQERVLLQQLQAMKK